MKRTALLLLMLCVHLTVLTERSVGGETGEKGKVTYVTAELIEAETLKPSLPDVSQFTLDWVIQQRDLATEKVTFHTQKNPKLAIKGLYTVPALREFTKGLRAAEWLKRQGKIPKGIILQSGRFTLKTVEKKVNDSSVFKRLDDNRYLVRLPILIDYNATLEIGENETLLLSQEKGAFIVNEGNFFVISGSLIGWNEKSEQPAKFVNDKIFRPFFSGFGLSESYFYDANVTHLGYFNSKSYGLTISSNPIKPGKHNIFRKDDPKAWLIKSHFENLYYGFYSFEAVGSVILDNTYFDSIVYGIDPHDYSEKLIIAYNKVTHTQRKHGIIISREVDNSWIFGNISTDNKLSGFVLDRQCSGNVIAYNLSLGNRGDGISFYESPDNLVFGNVITKNARHGVRLRNSPGNRSASNIISLNGQQGIYMDTADFGPTKRDLKHDPYTKHTDLTSIGDSISHNKNGAIGADAVYPIELSAPNIIGSYGENQKFFVGALEPYGNAILYELLRNSRRVKMGIGD